MKIPPSLKIFLQLFSLVFLLGAVSLLFVEKGDFVIFLNQLHSPFSDFFFKYITHFGDGLLLIGFLLGTLFISRYSTILLFLVAIFQGFLSYLLKRVIFKGSPRPKAFFEDTFDQFHIVEGVKVHAFNAFPSGHTLTAFSLAVFFCLFFTNKKWGAFALFMAILVGISRVYLFQHFLEDIVFGSLVGVLLTLSANFILKKSIKDNALQKLENKSFLHLNFGKRK